MIETNIQQHNTMPQQLPHPDPEMKGAVETGPIITCTICDAAYAPSPQQVPFLLYMQGTLEAAFMGMCHFCFRCRRAACPQCWDEVHGVCGSCVQEAGLPFRIGATPLDGLMFPPTPTSRTSIPTLPQTTSLFVPVRNGRFYNQHQGKPEPAHTDIISDHVPALQPAVTQTGAPDGYMTDEKHIDTITPVGAPATETDEGHPMGKDQTDTPSAVAIPAKTPLLEDSQHLHGQEETPRTPKKARKASRLEVVITWVVLVIVLALVVVIALAEFFPVVNALVERAAHIDIHAEITYLVHTVQQLFKR